MNISSNQVKKIPIPASAPQIKTTIQDYFMVCFSILYQIGMMFLQKISNQISQLNKKTEICSKSTSLNSRIRSIKQKIIPAQNKEQTIFLFSKVSIENLFTVTLPSGKLYSQKKFLNHHIFKNTKEKKLYLIT